MIRVESGVKFESFEVMKRILKLIEDTLQLNYLLNY